ncbi:MAG: electron transfer flavoprotein subunit beta/FixA family protein [Saprospiraceae bacterium]|tara:strand:- start:210 stop:953 length:744 start_codon:yes stop_codon:yes gene_type:complete
MKLLVCISRTPETTAKISFTDNDTQFNTEGVQYILNPFDEWYALVRAIELKEKYGGTVTVINVGGASSDIIIRKALSIGADDAVRVDTEEVGSAFFVAKQIAAHAESAGYDMILTGKETIDYNGSEVGAMVAEILDLPYVSLASHLEMEGDIAVITREIEGGVEVAAVTGPCVLSAAKGLAEQRIPNMKGIMMSKRKPLNLIPVVEANAHLEAVKYVLPDAKTGVKLVDPDDMEELVRLLHEEAKAI